ncbi:MAG: hypothetical protein ACKOCM_04920 [Cyanobacteriota bacterium]
MVTSNGLTTDGLRSNGLTINRQSPESDREDEAGIAAPTSSQQGCELRWEQEQGVPPRTERVRIIEILCIQKTTRILIYSNNA